MKRVLVAGVLGGLLLLGTPTLASSASRDSTRAEKGDGDKGGNKGGDHKGDRGDRGDRGDHRGDRDGHRGDRDGHGRHGYGRGGYGYGYGGYYGDSWYGGRQDCYRHPSGYTTCEEYGGDGYPYGYDGGYNYRGTSRNRVLVRGMVFDPPQVDVRPGEPVVWEFADREPHTVTADNGSFDSGQKVNDEFRLRFDQPGSYSYHCAIHPDMKGRVVVHG